MPNTVPNGPEDSASFGLSSVTSIDVTADIEVNQMIFHAGASGYVITVRQPSTLTISGTGVINKSGAAQNFVELASGSEPGTVRFAGAASAGDATYTNQPPASGGGFNQGGVVEFSDQSTADHAVFINLGPNTSGSSGGILQFYDNSSVGNATIHSTGATNHGAYARFLLFNNSTGDHCHYTGDGGAADRQTGAELTLYDSASAGSGMFTLNGGGFDGAYGAFAHFFENSTAADGIFIVNGGGNGGFGASVFFGDRAMAANATFVLNAGSNGGSGGTAGFFYNSQGGTSHWTINGNAYLDISSHKPPEVSLGSIQGDGIVYLGANALTVGHDNRSTEFAGVIQDGGPSHYGIMGTLSKVGTGRLTLSAANTYTGGTTVEEGTLLANTTTRSAATGSGPVQVNAGVFGGRSNIAGSVTIGSGSGSDASLAPGIDAPGKLAIKNTLTFQADGTYQYELNTKSGKGDQITAEGVTINGDATFSFADRGSRTLPEGTVLLAISNTAATSIAGTFSNLPDHSILTSGNNHFEVNYEGGDGNDLTLTVVPKPSRVGQ